MKGGLKNPDCGNATKSFVDIITKSFFFSNFPINGGDFFVFIFSSAFPERHHIKRGISDILLE